VGAVSDRETVPGHSRSETAPTGDVGFLWERSLTAITRGKMQQVKTAAKTRLQIKR
jgi:hypothetical protein